MTNVLKTVFITEFAIYNYGLIRHQIEHISNMIYKLANSLYLNNRISLNAGMLLLDFGNAIKYVIPALGMMISMLQGAHVYMQHLETAFKAMISTGESFADSMSNAIKASTLGIDYKSYLSAAQNLKTKLFTDQNTQNILFSILGLQPSAMRNMEHTKLLDTIVERLMSIENVSMRSAIGVKLFGEAWTNLVYTYTRMKEFDNTKVNLFNTEALHKLENSLISLKIHITNLFLAIAQTFGGNLANVLNGIGKIIYWIGEGMNIIAIALGVIFIRLAMIRAMMVSMDIVAKRSPLFSAIMAVIHLITGLAMFFGAYNNYTSSGSHAYDIEEKQLNHLSNIDRNTTMLAKNFMDIVFTTGAGTPPLYQREALRALIINTAG